ncbi:hypothetical protein ISCGN_013690 [Ixodes scapularis]
MIGGVLSALLLSSVCFLKRVKGFVGGPSAILEWQQSIMTSVNLTISKSPSGHPCIFMGRTLHHILNRENDPTNGKARAFCYKINRTKLCFQDQTGKSRLLS